MYNHNKAQQSKNRVHISWDILYGSTSSGKECEDVSSSVWVMETSERGWYLMQAVFNLLDLGSVAEESSWYHINFKPIPNI